MAEEKDIVHTQVDSASGQTHLNETEEETDAVLLDVGLANLDSGAYSSLELAKDGHTVLVPQPSSDPQDPLNWPWRKKHIMLLIVAFTALLGLLPDCFRLDQAD
ncbi:hypothetical protein MMC14_003972 [Varicellaria rhodocarpa]|nr:hypothetical protein [Varicellaria rhodocarpa]